MVLPLQIQHKQAANTEPLPSTQITEVLREATIQQDIQYTAQVVDLRWKLMCTIKTEAWASQVGIWASERVSSSFPQAIHGPHYKGASSWLTALPIKEFGFALHKLKVPFHDALTLQYNWQPINIRMWCQVLRGACSKGGYHPQDTMKSGIWQPIF